MAAQTTATIQLLLAVPVTCQWSQTFGFGGSGNQANNTGAVATGGSTTCHGLHLPVVGESVEASNTVSSCCWRLFTTCQW
jgi:hypothetical protein